MAAHRLFTSVHFVLLFTLCLTGLPAKAENIAQTHYDKDNYRIHYSVFNSRFITEATARALGIARSESRAIITIGVTKKSPGENLAGLYSLGTAASVEGTAANLMQQITTLDFKPVQEGEVTYYIATLDHINEEVFHFDITVKPPQEKRAILFRFSRKLHTEKSP